MAEERPSVKAGRAAASATASVEELSASAFQKYLGGRDYPAGKGDLISHARKTDAPDAVIEVLQKFNDRQYQSAADVSKEFGKAK